MTCGSALGVPQVETGITTAGTIYGMPTKTTVYLPDDLRDAVKAEAKRKGCSEAQFIRDAIASAVTRPRPNPGIVDGEPFAEHVDELLAGFGER
jgi:hypothetical protein